MLLQGKGMIQKHKAALTLVLRGSVGIQVHDKGSDEQLRRQLEKKKNYLAFLLGIPKGGWCCGVLAVAVGLSMGYGAVGGGWGLWSVGEASRVELLQARFGWLAHSLQFFCAPLPADRDWHASHPDFRAGAAEVRLVQVADYERMVEEHVFKRKLMEQHLEQESSGKNSNALKMRVANTRMCVLVAVLRLWGR